MKSHLKQSLSKIDDIDFLELAHALNIASVVRKMRKEFSLTDEQFAVKLSVSIDDFKDIIYGTYPFDLRMIAKIDAINSTMTAEKAAKEADSIVSFPAYRYQEIPKGEA